MMEIGKLLVYLFLISQEKFAKEYILCIALMLNHCTLIIAVLCPFVIPLSITSSMQILQAICSAQPY
jgi:hypothetical protein